MAFLSALPIPFGISQRTAVVPPVVAPAQPTGGWEWLNSLNPPSSRDIQEVDTPEPKRPKRKRLKAETIELAPDLEVQTGIIPVMPAWDALVELQRMQDEAEIARRERLRALVLADDEWLMMI